MHVSRTGSFVTGVVVTLMVGGGTAMATGGAPVLLGVNNHARTTTGLSDSAGTPLSLTAKKGSPPLKVSNDVKVKHLDADLLDGRDSSDFLGSSGTATNSARLGGQPASAYLGSTATAADSAKLAGQPASAFVASTYFSSTEDTPADPLLSTSAKFDATVVPAGTYSVALAAQVQNNDNTVAAFRCELLYVEPAGADFGEESALGLFPTAPGKDPTTGTVIVNQIITLPAATTISAFCHADQGNEGHTAFVSHSTLLATRLQDPHGTPDAFAVTPF
ncbi:hypothetical protein acdb102_21340 [Acidothermaceae bacterium B102]|nr:hypothetical protein acdb102_21340 [Acidothermaceae bacterium B102]